MPSVYPDLVAISPAVDSVLLLLFFIKLILFFIGVCFLFQILCCASRMCVCGSSLPGYGKPSFETIEFNYLLSDNDHT